MALFSRKNIRPNPYGLTEDDLKGDIKAVPMGVVVRMLDENELQGYEVDVKEFQKDILSGFDWDKTEAGEDFWGCVLDYDIKECDFELFFERYPEYARYNLA